MFWMAIKCFWIELNIDKMYKYEMDRSRSVGATEPTRDVGRMDGQSETSIPPNNFVVLGL